GLFRPFVSDMVLMCPDKAAIKAGLRVDCRAQRQFTPAITSFSFWADKDPSTYRLRLRPPYLWFPPELDAGEWSARYREHPHPSRWPDWLRRSSRPRRYRQRRRR